MLLSVIYSLYYWLFVEEIICDTLVELKPENAVYSAEK